jgi:hypothetical protein
VAKIAAVIGFVGDHSAGLDVVEQRWRSHNVVNLAAGEKEAQWVGQAHRRAVDFGGQSSSGAP